MCYVNLLEEGFFFFWADSSGVHEIGTKNLLLKFKTHNVESWTRAANLGIFKICEFIYLLQGLFDL